MAFSFGTAAAATNPAPTFGLGTATTSAGLGLGSLPLATSTAPTLGLGLSQPGSLFSKPATTTIGTSLNFGLQPTTSVNPASSTGIGLGLQANAPTTSFGLGGLGAPTSTTAGGLFAQPQNVAASATSAAPTIGRGLGGVDVSASGVGPGASGAAAGATLTSVAAGATAGASLGAAATSAAGGGRAESSVMKQPLPPELLLAVDSFRTFLAAEKKAREEFRTASEGEGDLYRQIGRQLAALRNSVVGMEAALHQTGATVTALKLETRQEMTNAELACRCRDLHPSHQFDSSSGPPAYFARKLSEFQCRMAQYKVVIDDIEAALSTRQNSLGLTSTKDIVQLVNRIQEAFLYLTSNLADVHQELADLKASYLTFRRSHYGDTRDPFTRRPLPLPVNFSNTYDPLATVGPTPFISTTVKTNPMMQGSQANCMFGQAQQPQFTTPGTGFGSNAFSSFGQPVGQPLKLNQPPPPRSKKGRR